MSLCSKCRERMYPESPAQSFFVGGGLYLRPICESCPLREAQTESKPQAIEHIHRHSDMGTQEFDLLQQTARKADYLEKQVTELSARRKPREKAPTYKGLSS